MTIQGWRSNQPISFRSALHPPPVFSGEAPSRTGTDTLRTLKKPSCATIQHMSGALPPVGASSGSSAAVPSSPPPLPQQQQQQQQEITAAHLADAIREIIRQQQKQQELITAAAARSRSDELRGWLMVVATLTASITYSAALNPPGGVWQDDDSVNGVFAGRPVLYDRFRARYNVFYYSNLTSFATSLCIIVLSSNPSFYNRMQRPLFSNLVAIDIAALAGAFITGSWTGPYEFIYGAVLLVTGLSCLVCFRFWGSPRHDIDQSV